MQNPQDFFRLLYQGVPKEYVAEIRMLANTGGIPQRIYRQANYLQDANFETIAEYNQTHNIYHRVALSLERKSRKQDIVMTTAIWMDIDAKSDEIYKRLEEHHYPPTMLIDSGGGWHAYWLLREPLILATEKDRAEFERTIEGLILDFGEASDKHVKDCTRILRTPFYRNIKDKYAPDYPLCSVVWADDILGDRYKYEYLHKRYAPLGAPKHPVIRRELPVIHKGQYPKWVEDYLAHGVGEGSRNKRLYDVSRALWDLGYEQLEILNIVSPRAASDGLGSNEISTTVKSACANPRNAATAISPTMKKRYALGDKNKK